MRWSRIAVVTVLLAVAPTAPAGAATIVAAVDGVTLTTGPGKGGRLCLALRTADGLDGPTRACRRYATVFDPLLVRGSSPGPLGIAVPGTVARITVQQGEAVRSVDTIGVDGVPQRFALLTGVDAASLLRAYDASGTLLGAFQDTRSADEDLPPAPVAFRDRGGVRVRVRPSFSLDPNPLQRDRTVPTTCEVVEGTGGTGGPCPYRDEITGLLVAADPACAPARPLVHGLVAPRITRYAMTLGTGRVLRGPTIPLPDDTGAQLLAVSVPAGVAVRSVRGLDDAGAVVDRTRLAAAPSGFRCAGSSTGLSFGIGGNVERGRALGPFAPVEPGAALQAADGSGTTLCLRVGGRGTGTCSTPRVEARSAFLTLERGLLHGVLPADVAAVEVRAPGGRPQRVATLPGAAYTGRYAGLIRFVAMPADALRRPIRVVALDAAGARLGRVYVADTGRLAYRVRRRDLGAGLRLRRLLVRDGGRRLDQSCVLTKGRQVVSVCGPLRQASPEQVAAAVPCSPRRAIVVGVLPDRLDGARLRLGGGRTLTASVRAVRGVGRVWRAVPPRDARVRGVEYLAGGRVAPYGDGGRDEPLRLPPAARQCGYVVSG